MRIITEAKITLLSYPTFYAHPDYELPEHVFSAENLIAHAGKGCYDSYGRDGRSVAEHIAGLNAAKHYSVLEHANFSVFIEGISRGCSHEIVRHRHFSYSQRSTRYTNEGDAAIVLDPYYASIYNEMEEVSKAIKYDVDNVTYGRAERDLVRHFIISCETSIHEYEQQVNTLMALNPNKLEGRDLRKWARGKARQLLPHALETRMTMTGNIRCWNEFFYKRISDDAEAEIREMAIKTYSLLKPWAPTAFIRSTDLPYTGEM